MRNTKYGKFKGKQLLVGDNEVEVNYLRGKPGEKVLRRAYDRIGGVPTSQQLERRAGSNIWSKTNPWINVAVNEELIEEGLRIAKLSETSLLVESDILDELIRHGESTYTHQYSCGEHYTSLVLQPEKMSSIPKNGNLAPPLPMKKELEERENLKKYNDLLYDRLAQQIRGKIGRIEVPVLINLSDLRLATDEKDYIFFNLAEDAEIIPVPQFSIKDVSPKFNNTHLEPFEKSFYSTDIETGLLRGCYESRDSRKARRLCLSGGGVNELYLFSRDFHVSFLGFYSLGKVSGERSRLAKITIVDELK